VRTADFDFDLPPELIAQRPAPQRDQSRLLVLERNSAKINHQRFPDLVNHLRPGDVLVLNNSRVIPARLRGVNVHSGGQFEILLLEENATNDWWAMLRPGKRARVGTHIALKDAHGKLPGVEAIVVGTNDEGHRRLRFIGTRNLVGLLDALGEVPLPPYIDRGTTGVLKEDRERYQTIFAEPPGSVAAPTAGLHFTQSLLDEIHGRGVQTCFVTLHVGLGTFAPVKSETLAAHKMHEERFEISEETARIILQAKRERRRVIAAGTTTLRALETWGLIRPETSGAFAGKTGIFVSPPYAFTIVDALITNFHLPRSTLLMLVSAFAAPREERGRELVLSAYREAIRQRYRFFSYGDAMFLV